VVITANFITYVNWQIVASNYAADAVLNFDETNIDFDPSPRTTLNKIGGKTISL
jgi:hypothetical protein